MVLRQYSNHTSAIGGFKMMLEKGYCQPQHRVTRKGPGMQLFTLLSEMSKGVRGILAKIPSPLLRYNLRPDIRLSLHFNENPPAPLFRYKN